MKNKVDLSLSNSISTSSHRK